MSFKEDEKRSQRPRIHTKLLTMRVDPALWERFRDVVRDEDGQGVSEALRDYMEARVR
jgi:hypothetical protein